MISGLYLSKPVDVPLGEKAAFMAYSFSEKDSITWDLAGAKEVDWSIIFYVELGNQE